MRSTFVSQRARSGSASFAIETVVQRVPEALETEGFGVLSDIDIPRAMKEKPGKDVPSCRIASSSEHL